MRKIIAVLAAAVLAASVSCGKDDDSNKDFVIENNIITSYTGDDAVVHIPDGVTGFDAHAFWSNCTAKAVYIPSSVRKIDENSFWSCPALTFVDISEGTEKISNGAFWACVSLKDVNIPASVKDIDETVFRTISGVTLHVPKGSYAQEFARENGVKWDNTPAEYEEEAPGEHISAAQYQGRDFTEFAIPDDITAIDAQAFAYCDNLTAVTIPGNVRYIASQAFAYCRGLRTAEIQGCREIRACAFEYCEGLENVTVGEGTEVIGDCAFEYCRALRDVYLPESLTSLGREAFDHCSGEITLHVPAGSEAERLAKLADLKYDNKTDR